MGNILTTVIGYNQTDVYVFKDTNNVITTMCRIQFLEVESTPSSVATGWVYSSVPNPLNPSTYDVTIEYKPDGILLSDYTLPVYNPLNTEHSLVNNTLSLVTFSPVAFIFNNDKVIVTPNASNDTFTVTIVDTNTIIVNTDAFKNAIFRVTTTETEIYGYVHDENDNDVAVTRNESITATSKNFDNKKRVVIQSIALTKGRWLLEATGSFDCSAETQVHFWFDVGGLLNELTLVPQYRDSLKTFNSQSNSNMSITMQSEFFLENSTLIYWCTTPDTEITSSIFSNTIPTPSTGNPFIDYAIIPSTVPNPPPSGKNNAKITAISISGV